jgi:hypothetical protein
MRKRFQKELLKNLKKSKYGLFKTTEVVAKTKSNIQTLALAKIDEDPNESELSSISSQMEESKDPLADYTDLQIRKPDNEI